MGDMTSEMRPSEFISEFESGGTKNYAYRRNKRKETVCKVRGITLNYNASKLVNFVHIKGMIL